MTDLTKTILQSLGSGLVGACALTILHETARQFIPNAPRADILGMRAIRKVMKKADADPPADDQLHTWALGGDVVGNALYYGLIGLVKPAQAPLMGATLGAVAGVGAVVLPGPMGLGKAPSSRTTTTVVMTIGWYLLGGLATAATYSLVKRR